MALSIDHLFFDIQHKRACWLKHAQELLGARQKPFDIAIRMNASVSTLPAICIWGRSDHQINAAGWLDCNTSRQSPSLISVSTGMVYPRQTFLTVYRAAATARSTGRASAQGELEF